MLKKTALLSVSDKTNIVSFARGLVRLGYQIISTGGTASLLKKNKIEVRKVSDLTGFPEILGGRVKTLQPQIFGGILSNRSQKHIADLTKYKIGPIDLVCVNLYPFAETIASPKVTQRKAIENIDIGGVSLLRAAAKNHEHVLVVSRPRQYTEVLDFLRKDTATPGKAKPISKGDKEIHRQSLPSIRSGSQYDNLEFRRSLAVNAFALTAQYDGLITGYLGADTFFSPIYEKAKRLRYGENPHQESVLYQEVTDDHPSLANAEVLQGKPLSFNNLVDAEVAVNLVADFTAPTASVIKHACPCGVAIATKIEVALQKALAADKKSPFGGIIALNQPVNKKTAEIIRPLFLEVIIAPSFDSAARRILSQKIKLRLLAIGNFQPGKKAIEVKKISGGLLVQSRDNSIITEKDLKVVTKKIPTQRELADLIFAANTCKHVKSNAIVLARDHVTTGIGAGQTARVDAVEIAIAKAGTAVSSSVLASDAFFPFADSIEIAARAGITAIIQPGGSIRDNEVIQAANKANVAMVFSGIRSFRH